MFTSPLASFFDHPLLAAIYILSIVAAITVHEFSHAWTADRLGDETPSLQGRLTLSPFAHLDPVGSICFLIAGFGWGKPVIYNPMRLGRKVDELLVALAGPASNLVFALALNILSLATRQSFGYFSDLLQVASYVNVLLASFNMIPIPPLDGSAIVAYFWPEYRSVMGGQLGLTILLLVVFVPFAGGGILVHLIAPIEAAFTSLTTLFGLLR